MTFDFTLSLGHVLTLGTTLASAYVGSLWALLRILAAQQDRRLAEKFDQLNNSMRNISDDLRKEADATRTLENSFLKFQAELPRDYVRRDDFVRAVGTIEARIDNFALRMERALDQVGKK